MENRNNIHTFIEKARKIHGDTYDYSKVDYVNGIKKVIIICKIHGDFPQDKTSHLQGCGCPKCGGTYKKDTQDFIIEARKIHGDKYDYSKVNYIDCYKEVLIICKEHGEFLQKPVVHINHKGGCTQCGINKRADGCRHTKEMFIEKAQQIHGNKYDYSLVDYKNNCIKVTIICNEHKKFIQAPNHHVNGMGCPKCALKKQYSNSSIIWLNLISKINNIQIQHGENDSEFKIPNTKFKADGYCNENNTIYEFHGTLWHGDPRVYNSNIISHIGYTFGELYQKTLEKEKIIKENGYNLVTMWEYDWKKINKSIRILQRKFKNYLSSV